MNARMMSYIWFGTGLLGAFSLFPNLSFCEKQPFPQLQGETVIETEDGQILAGTIRDTTAEILMIDTEYGSLRIPFHSIARIDGDRYETGRGLLREHTVTLKPNGDVTLDYLVPLPARIKNNSANILLPGNVIEIQDLNHRSLAFHSRGFGGYTRCAVQLPGYRAPAVYVRINQKQAIQIESGFLTYSYRYTPRASQIFRLRMVLPANAQIIQTTPEPSSMDSQTMEWECALQRQQEKNFTISYQLNAAQ